MGNSSCKGQPKGHSQRLSASLRSALPTYGNSARVVHKQECASLLTRVLRSKDSATVPISRESCPSGSSSTSAAGGQGEGCARGFERHSRKFTGSLTHALGQWVRAVG